MKTRALLLALMVLTVPSVVVGQAVRVDEPAVCYQCHGEIEEQTSLRNVHAAFADGSCSSCHNPHASRHAALLGRDGAELCAGCHEDTVESLAAAVVHPPAAQGKCVSCHEPHASSHAALLPKETAQLCTDCHPQVEQWGAAAVVHAPVAAGDCGTCHQPHGAANEGLLAGSVTELCTTCHDTDAAFASVHRSAAIGSSNCTACHDPHAAGKKGLLRQNQHTPFANGNCETCHGSLEGRTSFAVVGVRDLCERCHRGAAEFANFTYRHNLDSEDSCEQCHNSHASNVGSLLAADTTTLCMRCHFGEPTREKAKAEYMTHDAMDCAQCHVPHGAENAKYLKTIEVALCAECHESAHRVSHPSGPEVIDARTGNPVTCLSCHQLHGADFAMYLPLDPTRELCIQCHRR